MMETPPSALHSIQARHGSADDSSTSQHSPPSLAASSLAHQQQQPQQPPWHHQTPPSHDPESRAAPDQPRLQRPRSIKRPRPVKSCTECRKRKLRCDRLLPCSQCSRSSRLCKYATDQDPANLSDASDSDPTDDLSRPIKRSYPQTSSMAAGSIANDVTQRPGNIVDLTALPLLEELCVRIERLEKQVRVGSPSTDLGGGRAMTAPPSAIRGITVKHGAQRTRFWGQNSSRVLLNLFADAKAYMATQHNARDGMEPLPLFKALHHTLMDMLHAAMTPISVFVDSMMPVHKRMADILPQKSVCDRLVASYLHRSEKICRIIHRPTFSEQYHLYWQGKLQADWFLPQLLPVLSIASHFGTAKGPGHESAEGVHISTACTLVRSWLDSLKGRQLVDISTLQVEMLLLQAQSMIMPRAHDSWAQLGSVVRLAMTMGLHRDPSELESRMPAFHGELRRRLWYSIVELDLLLSLACSLPCSVRDGDFSCLPPRNLNDSDLSPAMKELPPTRPIHRVTDNQLQVYAAMSLGIRIRVPHLVNRIDRLRDYHEVLEVGTRLEHFLDEIDCKLAPRGAASEAERNSQWRNRLALDLNVRRPLLCLYRPLAMGAPDAPHHISGVYLRSSMFLLGQLGEPDPLGAGFRELTDMYQQMWKWDMMQAALSVCFYIQSANREGPAGGQQAARVSADASARGPSYATEGLLLWPTATLIGAVQRTLAFLMANISGNDTKDIVCLAIVLETVRKPGVEAVEIARKLHGVLDACLTGCKLTAELLQRRVDRFDPPWEHVHHRLPCGCTRGPGSVSDVGGWTMWEGWD